MFPGSNFDVENVKLVPHIWTMPSLASLFLYPVVIKIYIAFWKFFQDFIQTFRLYVYIFIRRNRLLPAF